MIIATWHIDARFGHKQTVTDSLKAWSRDTASEIGWNDQKVRISTGSIGALESTVEVDVVLNDLAELNVSRNKLGSIAVHQEWSKQAGPYLVSGTPRWEILRIGQVKKTSNPRAHSTRVPLPQQASCPGLPTD